MKLQNDFATFKDFMRTHFGGLEVSQESPLSEDIEHARIDRHLRIPSIDQFDRTTDLLELFLESFVNDVELRSAMMADLRVTMAADLCAAKFRDPVCVSKAT